jgi:hypothetical protein
MSPASSWTIIVKQEIAPFLVIDGLAHTSAIRSQLGQRESGVISSQFGKTPRIYFGHSPKSPDGCLTSINLGCFPS